MNRHSLLLFTISVSTSINVDLYSSKKISFVFELPMQDLTCLILFQKIKILWLKFYIILL